MGKKKRLLVLVCILLPICFPNKVRAEYYDNHVDRGDYCMQAKDVRITEAQREAWIKDGTLQEKILELSGVFVNRFHPSDSTRYWTEYDGGYEVDIDALKDLAFQNGKTSETVPITFHLTEKEGIFITVNVDVTVSEHVLSSSKDAAYNIQGDDNRQRAGKFEPDETTENKREDGRKQGVLRDSEKTYEQGGKEGHFFLIWLMMTVLAMLGYGGGLYSDFKVLRKYKQKREE